MQSPVHTARSLFGIVAVAVGLLCPVSLEALDVDRLDPGDSALLQSVLQHLEPLITLKKPDGTVNLLTWEELYQPLSPEERAFLDAFRALKAEALGSTSHHFGEANGGLDLVPVGPQETRTLDGTTTRLNPQSLPRPVLEAYEAMMQAMEHDFGKHLLVDSGYRAPAYQLYLFLFYLPKHDHSIRETNRHVALPGYSEHGYPPRQAIDFINQDGTNGEDKPEEFEALPEYQWLLAHAGQFGFHLSYPRDNSFHTAFEPWHWHYETPH